MRRSLLLLSVSSSISFGIAQAPGSFSDGGNTLVSAMMMFLGNQDRVYILDKAEGNAAQVAGHPAWASVWDIHTHQAQVMDVPTNTFCSSGMHLPNGSWVTFGGNEAVGRGGNPTNQGESWDPVYEDFDGSRAIRILNPCSETDNFSASSCQWFDDPTVLSMQRRRWYSAAEPLADGSLVIIGAFSGGGYVNRNGPGTDPVNGGAELTFEFFPARAGTPQTLQFLVKTSGLNSYAHSFLMPSGNMFLQANLSTILWDYNNNIEIPLPDMPNGVVRTYPASGAVAMLPLTPANDYTPTIIFCGGSTMPPDDYGNYLGPFGNPWEFPASQDCQRITPEPTDGSAPVYEQDDDMLEGRTMGQFIILPDGTLLVVNGGLNGTAGYAITTGQTPDPSQMPFGQSLASGPVGVPAIYDPNAPSGSRWSRPNFSASNIPRLYHSSAILLPDASVLIAGSNPNVDVNLSTIFPTTYQAEIFYPPYFSSSSRPVPSGMPTTISYGGPPFDLTIPASSYNGSANDAADNTKVVLLRGGFTTHAMNMGQRLLQLNNTYTVNNDGSIVLHVAQAPPTPNILQPGPALLFVTIHGIPSNGSSVIIGNGQIGPQPTSAAGPLPNSVRNSAASASNGTAPSTTTDTSTGNQNGASSHRSPGLIVGVIVAGVAVFSIFGALFLLIWRRNALKTSRSPYSQHAIGTRAMAARGTSSSHLPVLGESMTLMPIQQDNTSYAWNATSAYISPYKDDLGTRASAIPMSSNYDPPSPAPRLGEGGHHRS